MSWISKLFKPKTATPELKGRKRFALVSPKKRPYNAIVTIHVDGQPWRRFQVQHFAYSGGQADNEIKGKISFSVGRARLSK
jgi:hypothetical protein